jgi:Rod binding domain-containing protein
MRKFHRIREIDKTLPALDQHGPPALHRPAPDTADLRAVARALEAGFLEEMLKHAGFGEARGAFGGGVGEAQVASLLRAEQARALVARGGLGLSESLFQALVARSGGGP